MPRFSSKAKQVFDLIMYKTDIQSAIDLINELTVPFDICFAKICLLFYYLTFYKYDLFLRNLKEVEEINKINPDDFILFNIKNYYFIFYSGSTNIFRNNSIAGFELATKYYHEEENIYPKIDFYDEWEKNFCEALYYFSQGSYFLMIENNPSKGVEFWEKSNISFTLIPDDGEFLSKTHGYNNLGAILRIVGNFEESEKCLLISLKESEKNDNLWQRFPLFNLTMIYLQKGELLKAFEMNARSLNLFNRITDEVGMYWSLEMQGDLLFAEGSYKKALESYQESLEYRKKHQDGLELFKGYGVIFDYYYKYYKISKNKELFTKAEHILNECKKVRDNYPDDQIIKNYTNFYEACILKYGNLKKRAKADEIFENLIKIYPYAWNFVSEYLELLFEDYLVSEDEETINKIDSLITKIYDISLSITSIDSFVQQQIILSKYQFFIKNDIPEAIELLNKARVKIAPYKLRFLNSKIENNLESFKQEREKWDKIDITIKERIEKSEFNKYIQDALKMKII